MMDLIINNTNVLASGVIEMFNGDCAAKLGGQFLSILKEVFMWIQISVPCLVLVLCTVDIFKAVVAQDEKEMKSCLRHIVKRVAVGVAIFFVPMLINILFGFVGVANGTCGIGG